MSHCNHTGFPPFIKETAAERIEKQNPIFDLRDGLFYVIKSKFLIAGIIILITLNFLVIGALYVAIPIVVDLYGGAPLNLSYMEISLVTGRVTVPIIIGFFSN